jgi:hypothetical protein
MAWKCPCGNSTTPDPLCDMCDSARNSPDTGREGFTDHYLGQHFYSREERQEYIDKNGEAPLPDTFYDDECED